MHLKSQILDDALGDLYPALLEKTDFIKTSRGETTEIIGVTIEIQKPRARLSRTETRGKAFSCLAELIWYLSRDDSLEFIGRYIPEYEENSEDGVTVHGAYGPRLFRLNGINQIQNVINNLKINSNSRRAVIQLFEAKDIEKHYLEIPCTTNLQFLVREDQVHLIVSMRSNDAYKGLPHDIFCFTMLQEIIARSLNREIGNYRHFVGSMHLYRQDREKAEQYLKEEVQATIEMPPMPIADPWAAINVLIDSERRIRHKQKIDASNLGVDPYWSDLIRLLQIFDATGNEKVIDEYKSQMSYQKYAPYIDSRRKMRPISPKAPKQPSFKF